MALVAGGAGREGLDRAGSSPPAQPFALSHDLPNDELVPPDLGGDRDLADARRRDGGGRLPGPYRRHTRGDGFCRRSLEPMRSRPRTRPGDVDPCRRRLVALPLGVAFPTWLYSDRDACRPRCAPPALARARGRVGRTLRSPGPEAAHRPADRSSARHRALADGYRAARLHDVEGEPHEAIAALFDIYRDVEEPAAPGTACAAGAPRTDMQRAQREVTTMHEDDVEFPERDSGGSARDVPPSDVPKSAP